MTRRLGFVALALGLGWACTDEEKPPPPSGNVPDAGEGGDAGSGVSGSSVGGSSTGGSAGQGGSAGRGGQGGTRSGAGGADDAGGAGEGPGGVGTGGTGGPPPPCPDPNTGSPPTATCDPEGMLGAAMDVPLGDAAASLLAITPDELTIAWFNSNVMGESFWVADRALATDAFGAGQQLVHDITFSAMSPDGLRLVALSPGGQALTEVTRSARGTAFAATATESSFATLNADASTRGLTFTGCVISPDDRTLYYLVTDEQSDQPLRISERAGAEPWPVGEAIEACEFQAHGDLFSQPTGVSSDGLTLFFYDVARAQARAAWKRTPDGPFVWFEDLGPRRGAQPNTACDRLYYTSESGPSFSTID